MGVYYKLLNVTRKEQYEPANNAIKYGNFIWYAEEMLYLLLGDWAGDDVRLVNDSGGDVDLYYDSENWTKANPLYTSPDGEKCILNLDHNGMQKLLRQFVEALGPDAVAVALDAAIEKAEIEPVKRRR